MRFAPIIAAGAALALTAAAATAETRVTYKSAKTGTSYYQMGVEIAEAVKAATSGDVIVTVEESQGSVQNVMETRARGGDYVFTTPPALVGAAMAASGPFKDKGDPKFDEIRALFPIPSLTMHFVMRADSGATGFSGMAGKTILLGKGSFGAREGEKYLSLFGLEDKVNLADAELSNAVAALKNGRIDGFVTAGSWPAPNAIEAAASMDVTILSLTDAQIAETKRARITIPAETYAGQSAPIVTTSLPVVAYATTAMSDETAYTLTRAFWEKKADLAATAPWWAGVDAGLMENIASRIHPGAVRYYKEIGWSLTDAQE